MPHACTNCGRTFPDGSKEMLSGCPDCGGNKFRYHPGSVDDVDPTPEPSDRAPPDPDDSGIPARDDGGVVDRATTTVKEWVNQRSDRQRPPAQSPSGDDAASSSPGDDATPSSPGDDDAPGRARAADAGDSKPGTPESEAVAESTPAEDTAQADARTGVASPDELPDDAGSNAPPAAAEGGDETAPSAAPATSAVDADGTTAAPDTTEAGPDANGAAPDSPAAAGEGTETAATSTADAGDDAADARRARTASEPADPAATPGSSNLAQLREELNEQFESIKIVEPGQYELNLMGLYDREEYIISLKEDGRYAIEVPETWRDSEDVPSN